MSLSNDGVYHMIAWLIIKYHNGGFKNIADLKSILPFFSFSKILSPALL